MKNVKGSNPQILANAENLATTSAATVIQIFSSLLLGTKFHTDQNLESITKILLHLGHLFQRKGTNPKLNCLRQVYCYITTILHDRITYQGILFFRRSVLDNRKLKNGGKSSCVNHSFATVMTIRRSTVWRETFLSVDNIEVIDNREQHHGLLTDNSTRALYQHQPRYWRNNSVDFSFSLWIYLLGTMPTDKQKINQTFCPSVFSGQIKLNEP